MEQLGATREHKESIRVSSGIETISQTVPNIEIRLGGIHALARLAQESPKDAVKIEDMLLSYIRENSFLDRSGIRIKFPDFSYFSGWHEWSLAYRKSQVEKDEQQLLESWLSKANGNVKDFVAAHEKTKDSRADVSAALNSLSGVKLINKNDLEFEDSLFIKKMLDRSILSESQFTNCIFIRCKFDFYRCNTVKFIGCNFVGCSFKGEETAIHMQAGHLASSYFNDMSSCSISLDGMNVFGGHFNKTSSLSDIKIDNCTIVGTYFSGDGTVCIGVDWSRIVSCNFSGINFGASSFLTYVVFPKSQFNRCDLSQVKIYPKETLGHARASPRTLHPGLERPATWPKYDENAEELDDDIPF